MAEPIIRTQYLNLATGTVRTGSTNHVESRDDMDSHLLPLERARGAALHHWGVARGLEVSAVAGAAGLTVAPGTALDAAGHTIVLAPGSAAVTDPEVAPDTVQDVPTVLVGETGVAVATGPGAEGRAMLLTIVFREVEAATGGTLVLRHAPWLRLLPEAGFTDRGDQVVLARATLDAAGAVLGLEPGPRRLAGLPAGRLELRVPTGAPGTVGQAAVATLGTGPAGDVVLSMLGGPSPRPALRVTPAGDTEVQHLHTTGPSAGLSFDDRTAHEPVRWEWYALGGDAFLRAGEDMLKVRLPQSVPGSPDGAGFDVLRRMRVRSHGVFSAGIWFHQDRDRGFVGMGADNKVGLYGADGTGWGFAMDTRTGNLGMGIGLGDPDARLHVDGFVAIRAAGRTASGGPIFFPPSLRARGIGVDASGDIGIRSTGRVAAAQFNGNVSITGTLSKGGGGFTIDHPLDPEHRLLSHSFVESPEMTNLYSGRVTTGADGLARVELPDYFEALNRDVNYQLTVIGGTASVSIAEEVSGNSFAIRSDPPGATVCWLVTGVRQDPWAEANRIVAEVDKPEHAAERYLHPHVYGVDEERGIFGATDDTPTEDER
ncbi:hypothetical protein AB0M02_34285 [Actinoplanes sp. NPDC051861]|uniref:hypothetical protein n=1 Tax=Actinoplanes sp. NPDC051861 TaxID=3155170 RepID=UPI00343A3FAF